MKKTSVLRKAINGAVGIGMLFGMISTADAVPSFARQTGMTCAACHTVFPQLTPLGRQFKLNGYTMAGEMFAGKQNSKRLSEDIMAPLSLMVQVSDTSVRKAPAGTRSENVQFPEQLSLFYAGRIADRLGAFSQITYTQVDDKFSMDNTDIRYANATTTAGGTPLVWGVTLNNAPTVQDIWNSTPVWGFPFMGGAGGDSNVMLLQDGALNQTTAGLTAYANWNNLVYGEAGIYRAAQIGGASPADASSTNVVKNNAPYWRLALNRDWGDHNLMVGALGMKADIVPNDNGTNADGPSDKYVDTGLDGQYQYLNGDNSLTIDTSYINENQTLDASADGDKANLHTFKLNGTYYWKRRFGGSLGYLSTSGDKDQITATSGGPADPDTRAWTAELDYLPWLNTKLGLQYVAYDKLDGTDSNASDNNTLYANAWFMF
jgi:hypothetical protein